MKRFTFAVEAPAIELLENALNIEPPTDPRPSAG
jgi:hypothetical protein